MTVKSLPTPREGVRRFASDLPDHVQLLRLICRVARERHGLEFPGTEVYQQALSTQLPVLNNLSILATRYGILEKVGPSTPRRAYYRMIDLDGTEDELAHLPIP